VASYIDEFFDAYVETALWSSLTDEGQPMDEQYSISDIDRETLQQMREDVNSFVDTNWTDLEKLHPANAGKDFWLTRNGHGAGFWDKFNEAGDRLSVTAHLYGSIDLYIGDDEKIHS
jgi:hypothetical protein